MATHPFSFAPNPGLTAKFKQLLAKVASNRPQDDLEIIRNSTRPIVIEMHVALARKQKRRRAQSREGNDPNDKNKGEEVMAEIG